VGWWCKHDERVTPTLTDPIEGASQGFLNPSWTLKERETPILRDPIEGTSQGFLDPSWTLKERETLGTNAQIIELSKNQFACNSFEAFEELTRLHMRAENLHEHEKRGEANRDRLATVRRKASAASSAESAFRKCVSSMMPELLNLWDEKFKLGQIDFKAWNDAKEKAVDGISLQTLEETAKSMDNF